MTGIQQRKVFTAERHLHKILGENRPQGGGGDAASSQMGALAAGEIMEILQSIKDDIAEIKAAEPPPPVPIDEEGDKDIRLEIAQMVRTIGGAKRELASIRHPSSQDDRIESASTELDAIVVATETATQNILNSSESIDLIMKRLEALHPGDENVTDISDEVAGHVIKVMESCNFQDITGQRITKVVATLKFIEEHIVAMIDICGGIETFENLPVETPPDAAAEDDPAMHGPQMENEGISQDDIDAMFD